MHWVSTRGVGLHSLLDRPSRVDEKVVRKRRRQARRPKNAQEDKARVEAAGSPAGSAGVPRPRMSGRYDLLVVSEFPPGDSRNSDPTRPDGEPGLYLVTFVLAPPGDRTYRADVDFTTLMNGGDSLIETGPEARIGVRHPIAKDVELRLDGNVAGRLAKVSLKVSAEGFTDAAHQAKSIVLPYVSWVSYRHDVAVPVAGYEVLETRSEAR